MDHTNNGIAVHANRTMHDIRWDSAEILGQKSNWLKRKLKEALYITGEDSTMNGFPIWSALSIT